MSVFLKNCHFVLRRHRAEFLFSNAEKAVILKRTLKRLPHSHKYKAESLVIGLLILTKICSAKLHRLEPTMTFAKIKNNFSAYWNMIDVRTGPINATAGTGVPFLSPYSDHYLHFESSNLPWNSTAALFSPVYDKILGQNGCLSLQFSMNGANMGSLSLYLVPENDSNFTTKVN